MVAAGCILILPLRWVLAAVMAACVHELAHITALKICRIRIRAMEFGAFGAVIEAEPMCPKQQLICAIAGPWGSFLGNNNGD